MKIFRNFCVVIAILFVFGAAAALQGCASLKKADEEFQKEWW